MFFFFFTVWRIWGVFVEHSSMKSFFSCRGQKQIKSLKKDPKGRI